MPTTGRAHLVERSGDTALAVVRGDDPGIVPGVVTDTDVGQAVADGRDLDPGPAPGVSPPAAR